MPKTSPAPVIAGSTSPVIAGSSQPVIAGSSQPVIAGSTSPVIADSADTVIAGLTRNPALPAADLPAPVIAGLTDPVIAGSTRNPALPDADLPAPDVIAIIEDTPAVELLESTTVAPATTEEPDIGDVEAGLDALQTTRRDTTQASKALAARIIPPLIAIGLVLLIWQLVVWAGVMPIWNLPGPYQVLQALGRAWNSGQLRTALFTSLERGIIGFLFAVLIGTPLGILIARVKWIRMAIGPIVTGLQVLPSVAWVPAAVIWFGLSNATVYFVVLMGAVPSIINGLVAGIDQVPPNLRRVGRVLGAGPIQMMTKIILPAALPGFLAGLKQGWAFSWRALMAAEIIAVGGAIGFGLGAFLQQGRDLIDMAAVIAAIVTILVVGIAIEMLFFSPVERGILRRRGLGFEAD